MQNETVTAPTKRRAQMQRISPYGLALYTASTSVAVAPQADHSEWWNWVYDIREALSPASD